LNEHDDVIYFTVLTRAPTTAIWPPWPNVLVSPLPSRRLGVNAQSTMRRVKHFNNAPNITSSTHHHTWIWQWERNDGILTPNFEVNS